MRDDGTRGDGRGAGLPGGHDRSHGPADTQGSGGRRAPRQQTPTQRALGLLTRREHSRRELTRKLVSRGLEAGEVHAAVERLAAAGWQDDQRFAESLVRSRAQAGYGPIRIRAELGIHGLDRQAVDEVMEAYADGWQEAARELVRRRFGPHGLEDEAVRRKATEMLLRRGFDLDCARTATRFDPDT